MLADPRSETAGRRGGQPVPAPLYCFSVTAAAEPGVMPRVLQLFAKRNLVPTKWVSRRVPGNALEIDIQVAALALEEGDYIAECLRRLVDVDTVLTCSTAHAA
jgi:hypothetical protein